MWQVSVYQSEEGKGLSYKSLPAFRSGQGEVDVSNGRKTSHSGEFSQICERANEYVPVLSFGLFDSSCLRSWLEQDTSCPTCRMSLNIADGSRAREDQQGENLDENLVPVAAAEGRPRLNQHNHFFHFDGKLSVTFTTLCGISFLK